MQRGKLYLTLAFILLLTIAGLAGVGLMVNHVPSFYRKADIPAGDARVRASSIYVGKGLEVLNYFAEPPGPEPWEVVFTEAQINSYFEESFIGNGVGNGDAAELERQGISSPRVCIEQDHLRLAFRYETALISTVISLDLHIWLVPNETNVIAVEILGRHAGALPMSVRGMQDYISGLARKYKMEVMWYRHEGHPVALLRLKGAGQRPPSRLRHLDFAPGTLTIGGISLEPASVKGKLPPNSQTYPMAN